MKSNMLFFGLAVAFFLTTTHAQQAAVNLTAKSANVSESGTAVRMNILRWSNDEERNALITALNPPPPPPAPAAGAPAGERGGAAGGRGGGAARGGAAGGRGRGRGDAPAAPLDPIAALTAAIDKAPTIGYIWTTEVVGYSVKYAYHAPLPDGGERIILATNRRLGGNTTAWKPAAPATPPDYEFTLIEIRLDPKGLGQGKASLTNKVVVDNEAKTVALDNYAAAPAVLQTVKR